MEPVEIYALSHPETGEVRYIGKAINTQNRLKSHLRETRRKTPLYCWIKNLREEGFIPHATVIRITDSENWAAAEREEIEKHRKEGFRLLNLAEGGNEPLCSTETRAENGRKNAKAIHSNPERKKLWSLLQGLGKCLNVLKKYGRTETIKEVKTKLANAGIYI